MKKNSVNISFSCSNETANLIRKTIERNFTVANFKMHPDTNNVFRCTFNTEGSPLEFLPQLVYSEHGIIVTVD